MKRICHICHSEMEEIYNYPLSITRMGVEFKPVDITAHVCPVCGETIFTDREMQKIEAQAANIANFLIENF